MVKPTKFNIYNNSMCPGFARQD
ncbi:hypothetical protein ZEAMMB73_Zm00001d003146 [Zea mays]|uniref:Uncharacterized protein n=1 Tax=Zea mays TaxID=4577 RepID=A0A1D6E702_MAIZE|nr:hypothetical protein ZEAMMB73_Zm00001d003146 [Zea mays]